MAYNYSHTPVLSKIQIGENTYFLKDADVRAILDTFNQAVVTAEIGGMNEENKLVYAQNIKSYVDQAVAVGLVVKVVQTLPTASASTMGKIYMVQQSGGQSGDYYNEYITVQTMEAGQAVYTWELIGDTRIDLSGYVTAVSYSNGTLSQTKGGQSEAVHTFGDLADADTASGSFTPAGSVSKPAIDVNPTTDTVAVKATDGSVTAGTAPSFTEGTFTPNVPTVVDTTKFSGGSKAADTWSAGTLPSKAADSFSAGTLPSKAADTWSAGTLPTLAVGTGENAEALIFTPGTLPSYTEGAFSAGTLPSYTEGSFDAGSLPSFTEGAFTPAEIQTGFYTAGSAASKAADTFSAGTPTAVTLPTFENATVVTGVSAELHENPTFTGVAGTVTVIPDSGE